ncbi:hypothetical protein [Streptomyces sp. or20]|uniref:hypothetical protein n=1 Tax=Streptomyces sp. or20 TaxID=1828016 RepID=UPI000BF0F5B7|nr:hypothetical protein [Streptomyces sp. or20]
MKNPTNPEEIAALAAVPDIERTRKLHESAKTRLARHPAGEAPDHARNTVVAAVVDEFQASGTWPRDVGARAAKAFTDALEWEAERLALQRAVDVTDDLAHATRETLSDDALAFLGERLRDILSATRKAAESLGDVQSAEDAIRAGGDAVGAWSTLSALLDDYRNVRSAQWEFLTPQMGRHDIAGMNDQRKNMRQWKRDGHGHVMGFNPDNVPADVLTAMQSGRYTVAYLRWVASIGTAYVPGSRDELETEVQTTEGRNDVEYDDNGPVQNNPFAWHEAPVRDYGPAEVYPHSRAPQMDDSAPTPPKPKPNATVGDSSTFLPENPRVRAARTY